MDFATFCRHGEYLIQTVFIANTEFNTDTLENSALYVHKYAVMNPAKALCGEGYIEDGGFFHCKKWASFVTIMSDAWE